MKRLWVIALFALLAACASKTLPPAKDDSLYQALGQKPGITRIVEGMLLTAVRDPRIGAHFRNVDPGLLRDKLVEKFCVEAGGPCTYTGVDMAEAHKGQRIDPTEFNALVEDLIKSMDTQNIPVPVQNRLLARLAAQRGEVMGK